ncbi:MAG: MurR/RpiR family transcriptional regulator [Clostridium sp.]|nr:MurR/RpiR family transcriptional regulator [Clostridium sp.]
MGEVYQKVAEKMPSMSRAQEKIAKYILAHPNSIPFLTVEKLAGLSGVSIATITRFVTFLGYKGYPEFLKETQEAIKEQVKSSERIKIKDTKSREEDNSRKLYDVFEDDINNIKYTMEELNIFELKKAVNLIVNAKRIYLVARRSSTSLAVFLKYYLELMFSNVVLIENIEQIPKQINRDTGEDVIIGISFDKYAKSAVEIFTHLKDRGANTIAITDSMLSPLVPYADVTLKAAGGSSSFSESFAGPLSLINAVIVSIEQEKQDCYENNVHMLEEALNKFELVM